MACRLSPQYVRVRIVTFESGEKWCESGEQWCANVMWTDVCAYAPTEKEAVEKVKAIIGAANEEVCDR